MIASSGCALILGPHFPERASSAGGARIWEVIETLQSRLVLVHFASSGAWNSSALELQANGVRTHRVRLNTLDLVELLPSIQPDWVIYDRFLSEEHWGPSVRTAAPRVTQICEVMDFHALRKARAGHVDQWDQPPRTQEQWAQLFDGVRAELFRELASFHRVDALIVLSDVERWLLSRIFGLDPRKIFVNRFHYRLQFPVLGLAMRQHIGFIGNYRHGPNLDAVLWFAQKLWPEIRRRVPAETRLRLAGSYLPPQIASLGHRGLGIEICGSVKNAREFLGGCRINLAPLRFGAGIKGKLADGWSQGTPCVATPLAIEGMGASAHRTGIIVRRVSAHAWARAISRLYHDPVLWHRCSEESIKLMGRSYDADRNANALFAQLESIRHTRTKYRASAWVGELLQTEERRASHYLGLYLRLKNDLASAPSGE